MKFRVEWLLKGPGGEVWAPNKQLLEADDLVTALVKASATVTKQNDGNGALDIIGCQIEPDHVHRPFPPVKPPKDVS